jgi:hypothetical protein
MTVFRCDMLVLLAPVVLVMLMTGEVRLRFFPSFQQSLFCAISYLQINLRNSLFTGILVCSLAVGVSVLVDSYFWKR